MEYNSITRLSITLVLTIMLISLTSATLSYSPTPITLQTGDNYFGAVFNNSDDGLNRTIPLSVGQNLIGVSSRNDININNVSFSNSSGTYNYSIMESGGLIESIQCYNASAPLLNKWVTIKPKVCVFDEDIQQIVCTPNQETLPARDGCFVTVTQAMNMTFLNAGGTQIGDTFPLANIKFNNGTSELNCSQAYTSNWFNDSCDTLIRYWNTTYGYIDEETMQWVSSPRWEYIGATRENYLLSSWEGYYIISNLNSIQMIFDETASIPTSNETVNPCANKKCRKGIKIGVGHNAQINKDYSKNTIIKHKIIIGKPIGLQDNGDTIILKGGVKLK